MKACRHTDGVKPLYVVVQNGHTDAMKLLLLEFYTYVLYTWLN